MKNNILEIMIGNTTFTVEAKNAEISTVTPVDVLKKMASDEALEQQSNEKILLVPLDIPSRERTAEQWAGFSKPRAMK